MRVDLKCGCAIAASIALLSGCASKKPMELPPPPSATGEGPSYSGGTLENVPSTTGTTATATTKAGTSASGGSSTSAGQVKAQFWSLPVYFGTDRKAITSAHQSISFGGNRGDAMSYGVASITIPKATHEVGVIERPKWWKLQFSESSDRDFTTASVAALDVHAWAADIARDAARSPNKPLLVFIHGYNEDFENGLYRTAQIAFDVRFPGPAVLFSWASEAKYQGYSADEATVDFAEPDLVEMLRHLLDGSGAANIYLVAHSMGNRILTQALLEIGRTNPGARARIKDVILAAPDIDAAVFKRSIAPHLASVAQNITLYASSGDEALRASHALHSYPRLGDTNGGIITYPPMVTIDASSERSDFLGHSYISESPRVLRDLRELILRNARPQQRGLVAIRHGNAIYWRFPKTARGG